MRYKTIVADPPWPYKSEGPGSSKVHRPHSYKDSNPGSVKRYGSMPIGDLWELNVGELAAKRCHLYLWTTTTFMVEAHRIAAGWGFTVRSILTWVKQRPDGLPSMKCGYYYRGASEFCLFCVRGKPMRLAGPACGTWFGTKRLPHSVKPNQFYKMVEEQSPGPYLEMFARRKRLGWSRWGNELDNDVELINPNVS